MQYDDNTLGVTWLDWLALTLVIVGALNWGLVGLGGILGQTWNLVDLLLGWVPVVENLMYVLVGLAGIYELYFAWQLRSAQAREPPPQADTPT